MFIVKSTLNWQTASCFPNSNFSGLDDAEVWVIEDETELANKIIALKKHWNPVVDEHGDLIDVVDNDPTYNQRAAAKRVIIEELAALKEQLASTDYVACKIAEGSATAEEYAEVIEARRQARVRINELENLL